MTHVELPEVLVLAHQILQLLLKIQPVDQSHKMRGHGLRHSSPPWPRPGVSMHRPWETCSCSLLGRKHLHHLDPPSLSPAGSSSKHHSQYYHIHNPSQPIAPPILPGTGHWALPQLPLFVLLFLNLGIQGRNSLLALLQHALLPGKRQGGPPSYSLNVSE